MSVSPDTRRAIAPSEAGPIILEDVSWSVYEQLRDAEANDGIRMTYDDGRLALMSPGYRHERNASRLGLIVMAVTGVLGIPCTESRSTTFRRKGKGRKKGKGTEPDTSFYLAREATVRGNDEIDLDRDPPPDLAIEIDDSTDSESKLAVYAALGVPEVWRLDVEEQSLSFRALHTDGTYHDCDRSQCLPMLTPGLVVDWLRRAPGLSDSEWFMQLLGWVRSELPSKKDR